MPYSRRAKYYHHRWHDPEKFVEEGVGPEGEESQFQNVPLGHTDYGGGQYDPDVDRALIGVHEDDVGKEGPRGGKVTRIQAIQQLKDPLERAKKKYEARGRRAGREEKKLTERSGKKLEQIKKAKKKVKEQVAYEKGAKTEHQRTARERMTKEAKAREAKLRKERDKIERERREAREDREFYKERQEAAELRIKGREEQRQRKKEKEAEERRKRRAKKRGKKK